MFLSLWVSFECTFVGEWKERVLLLCVSECIRSANRGAEELRNCSGLLSCGRLALALLSVGSSGSLRSRPRWFGFSAAILSSQFSILRFSPLSAARFSSLDSPIRIVLALQFAVLQLQRCRRRCLRSCVLVTSSSISVFVVCLLLTLVAVCEFFIYFPHTHTLAHTFPMLPLPRLTTRTREKPFTCVFLMTQNFLVDMPGH